MSLSFGGANAAVPGVAALHDRVSVASYTDYLDAQRAVDHLADNDFPVQHISIVGNDLKLVESVTGKMSYPRAAGAGALSGAWFGVLVGLMIVLFTTGNSGALVLVAAVYGGAFGVIYAVIAFALTGGRRDFSSRRQVIATHFDVLVDRSHLEQARGMLTRLTWSSGRGSMIDPGQPPVPQPPVPPAADQPLGQAPPFPPTPTGGTGGTGGDAPGGQASPPPGGPGTQLP